MNNIKLTTSILLMLFTVWAVVSISIALVALTWVTESYFFKVLWVYIAYIIIRNTCRYIKKLNRNEEYGE